MTFRQINLSAVETTITALADPLIALNSSASGSNSKDLGVLMNRGSDTNVALLWDESTDQFAFVSTNETGTTLGDVTISSYSDLRLNDLIADNVTGATIVATTGFTGNLTGNVVGSTTGINFGNVTSNVGTSTFNNITMAGNLIVNGTTTTVSSTNTTLADNLIELNSGAGDNDSDAGIVIERGTTGDNAFMGWDESSDSFILGTTTATGSSIGNLTITPTALQLGSLDITDTTTGSAAGPVITLTRNASDTAADGNYIGQLKFKGDNDAGSSQVFAKITGKIDDASNGTEDGLLEFANKKAGSNVITARLTSDNLKLINGTGLEVDGNVGIGTTSPSEKLHVVGNILASGDVTAYSDERLKDNIQTIDGALGKVNSMRGVTYTKDGLESSGVIAQEIEKIAPELVKDGEYKSVAYGNLVGYLIEAIKEQQKQIEQSKTEIDNLKKLIGE